MPTIIFRRTGAITMLTLLLTACGGSSHDSEPNPDPTGVTLPTSTTLTGDACTTPAGAASKLITADCADPAFTQAFIDIDEQRTTTDANKNMTVTYRYVHGGFTGTNARFSFYFPAPDKYQGRFFESTYPTITVEAAEPAAIVLAIANGAYAVSTNNGGGVAANPGTGGYRVNAAAAKYSRTIAALIYGNKASVRGYIYGASGGAYQTMGAAENTDGVWDGAVPMVPGVPNAIPSFQSAQVLALRVLQARNKWPDVVDALEPGGSGDPYATLNAEEKAALEEATKLGHPLRGWWQWQTLKGGAFSVTVLAVNGIDGGYVNDFWSLPGYEGVDDPSVPALRTQLDTSIANVSAASLTLQDIPTGFLDFADLVITSGAAAGKTINGISVAGNVVSFPKDVDPKVIAALAAGDQVRIDNSLWIGLEFYQRHQVPAPDQYGWNQYRDANGEPLPVQRPVLAGQIIAQVFGGVATGHFHGKMIMLSSVLDVQAFPWSADWYHTQAQAAFGDTLDDNYRLWYMDNADHQPPSNTAGYAHIVLYDAELEQALLDLDAWVKSDVSPPANSHYTISSDNQVELADSVDERGGVQPVVTLAANAGACGITAGGARADIAAGTTASFSVAAAAPAGTGKIVKVEWDFESTGKFADSTALDVPNQNVQLCTSHTYTEPGIHFAVVRVTAQREGNPDADFGLIQNLARVRVVVQ